MTDPKTERSYTIPQILRVIKNTTLADGLPLGISVMDVLAGFKLLDKELEEHEAQKNHPEGVHSTRDPVRDPGDVG